MDKLYTVNQAAARLSITPYYLREMLRDGRLTGYKINETRWRVMESDLEAFAAKRQTGSFRRRSRRQV